MRAIQHVRKRARSVTCLPKPLRQKVNGYGGLVWVLLRPCRSSGGRRGNRQTRR